ncbi:putative methyltransferase tdiE [Colletotrichum fructicola]|nr:putative methyltransferase tdiE [Colletotrichum fructicola]
MQRNPCTCSAADSENRAYLPQEIDTERLSFYTASLASSSVDYPIEYGRRYHAFRPGSYVLPNDEVYLIRDGPSRLRPRVVHPKDSGYRNWDRYLGYVIGNDLSAIQPEWVPPNVKFEIDDVESPWIGDRKLAKAREEHLRSHLNPGGWVEFQDTSIEYYSDDGTLTEEHFFRQWSKTLVEAIASIGREPSPGPKLEGWIRNTGFQRINHSKIKIPLAPWPRDPFYKALGAMNLKQVLDGLEGFTMRVFCGVLGQTQEEVQVMMAAVRNELKKLHSFHSQFDLSASS